MYRILIADDDPSIVRVIKEMLKDDYAVCSAGNGEDALRMVRNEKPDLIILDVMMPKMNGIEATVKIREISNSPILILSAKAEGSDRVIGLTAGADDYLVKPFYREELLARVQALLRRYDTLGSIREAEGSTVIVIRDAELRKDEKKLIMRGEPVHLTPTEYRITEFLMDNPGHVFTAEEIYSHVWESEAYSVENTVMVHISRIRDKIELNSKKPEYLKVVWGIGYVFE
ncbi:MAG: response regulator transcription factor [Lachnospiraceae bacterium]|nr:response regulator transcription factor [Lachnospiraceae bacterium]